jgi:hypothetical protein
LLEVLIRIPRKSNALNPKTSFSGRAKFPFVVIIPTGQDDKVREKKINPRNLEDEEEEEDINTTKGWTEEIERRKLKWWEILLFQKEVKEGRGRGGKGGGNCREGEEGGDKKMRKLKW